ncbi:MAG TPA: hypothetical protein VKW04_24680 [Planctomycetota bacterium]|nr:hypothetical protein [Planctomycetota bacterium]
MAAIPVDQWPEDRRTREVIVQHWFGRALMAHARDVAWKKIPSTAAPEAREMAKKAVLDALYGVLQILDGVTENPVDAQHAVEFLLLGRVLRETEGGREERLEEYEIGPGGDGLCRGFSGWIKDDFGGS